MLTTPLADRLRPQSFEDFVGQSHLLSPGKPLRTAIENGVLHSMIFWGPPGTGKTTLAQLLAQYAKARFEKISAVMSGVKDIRAVVDRAQEAKQNGQATILFVDEVHRFNKSQQDAFLPFVENGTLTLVGATTENPSFELNSALLSRARVYVLKSLTKEEILKVIDRAILVITSEWKDHTVEFPQYLRELVAEVADGDARYALNIIELIFSLLELDENPKVIVTEEMIREVLGPKFRRFDKQGENFYDQISALHKSVRGSSPDAALYWYCRMLDGGCDPLYIARRVVRMATEDIGNADPRALDIALNAWDVQERLGSPEGELAIAQAIIYMACAAKSNASYTAFQAAMADVKQTGTLEVPLHLRNAPTKLMQQLGYGKTYRYAHDEPNAYAAGEHYFPEGMKEKTYYHPTTRGLELKIREKLAQLKQWDEEQKRKL